MEEIYKLSDGSQVDVSGYSENDKIKFFIKNPTAKKFKGGAKSAVVAPVKKAQPKSLVSESTDGSWDARSQADLNLQRLGLIAPPSEKEKLKPSLNYTDKLNKITSRKIEGSQDLEAKAVRPQEPLPKSLTGLKIKGAKTTPIVTEEETDNLPKDIIVKNNRLIQLSDIKRKQKLNDIDLINPYLYYSSNMKKQRGDQGVLLDIEDAKDLEESSINFVNNNYDVPALTKMGVNLDNFDGWLNKSGQKKNILKKQEQGVFEGSGKSIMHGYDIDLAREMSKKKALDLYMQDMSNRDFLRQDLTQDEEIYKGVREQKEIKKNELFDNRALYDYYKTNFPTYVKKMDELDLENKKLYKQAKTGGTDFWSWDTPVKITKNAWNMSADRIINTTATTMDLIGLDTQAEGSRLVADENMLLKPNTRGVGYVSGKTAKSNGTNYLVDAKGNVYDADDDIVVTDLLDKNQYDEIVNKSKTGQSDYIFSGQGAAVTTTGVIADMVLQAAIARATGNIGYAASAGRVAMTGRATMALGPKPLPSASLGLMDYASNLMRKLPIKRDLGYTMIAQGAMGYSSGLEDTFRELKNAGVDDGEAYELAGVAAQRMAVLYAATTPINPQTNLANKLFLKNTVKQAVETFKSKGKTGFFNYLNTTVKNAPRNTGEFFEDGLKEVVQENIQQTGEIMGVNALTNKDAGRKIMNETISGDDFINTSMISFISSGLMAKAKMPSFKAKNEDLDKLRSLSTLSKNKDEFNQVVENLYKKEVFTKEEVDNLKADVDIYSNNANKMPKSVSPKAAMPILRSLDKIQKLKDEKESLDKAFHPSIDEKIKKEEKIADDLYYADDLETKNKLIKAAIDKKVIKDIEMQTFGSSAEIKQYLLDVVGMPEDEADSNSKRGGFFLDDVLLTKYANQSGKDTSGIVKGKKVIFVNEDVSIKGGTTDVAQHEFLHGLIHETLKNSPESQILLGKALHKEIIKISKTVSDENTVLPQAFRDRINKYSNFYMDKIAAEDLKLQKDPKYKRQYDEKVSELMGNSWEEVLTLYSDAISNGSVQFNENVFTGLKDTVRQVLQNLGLRKVEFKSGRDVYNFLKDYNKSVKTGNFGIPGIGAMRTLGQSKAFIDKEALRLETGENIVVSQGSGSSEVKPSLGGNRRSGEKKSSEDIKKDVDNAYDKETFTQKTNSQRDPLLYDIVQEYEYLIKGKAKSEGFFNLPGFERDRADREEDFIAETKVELMLHIRNFNKEFLALREEYKQDLISKGFDPNSKEFKEILEAKDAEGYKGKKGIVKENNSLNGWINSQVLNKMKNALQKAGIVDEKFTMDVEGESFVEGRGTTDIGETPDYLLGDSVDVMEATEDFNEEQEKLANILKDPVFRFVDEKGDEVIIDTVPERGDYVISAKDQGIEANKQLKIETDPVRIEELKKDLRDLQRGLDLQNKEEPLTPEEKQELKSLKPTKAFNLTTGNVEYVFKAIIKKESPARIVAQQVAEEILRSPNVETLEFRNFKKLLADKSMVMMKRITFETGEGLESLMYNNWKLVYDVINNPVDEVTGQSSYASKKIPPYLKERNEKGEFQKVADINRAVFLQSFYSEEDAKKIIRKYNSNNPEEEISKFLDYEQLTTNAWFDRRTALRELFGDVMVLQEARRLLRNPDFIEKIGEEKPNLYNSLKDDVIRTQVLNDLAKGKSSSVKFSLAQDTRPKAKITSNDKNILKTEDALLKGIANNILYAPYSLPTTGEDIKYSLEEVLSQKTDLMYGAKDYVGYNKKYSVHFKPTFDEDYAGIDAVTMDKNFYVKALQYSDAVDDGVSDVKLHTLKNYDEVENEVVRRVKDLLNTITLQPAHGTIASYQKEVDSGIRYQLPTINPYLIDDYRDGYVEAMLKKSIKDKDQEYIDLWSKLKESEIAKQDHLYKIKLDQKDYLDNLSKIFMVNYTGFGVRTADSYHNGIKFKDQKLGVDKINEISSVKVTEPNNLKFNPFFTYVFLKDVLSNRYDPDPNTETVERKPFKKSEYKNTERPIANYEQELVEKVWEGFSHIESKNPALIYGYLFLEKNRTYVKDWSSNRDATDFENNKIFKFEKSTKSFDGNSLSALAAKNTSKIGGAWCTGQSAPLASRQLSNGQFFIAADKKYIPVTAIRFDEDKPSGVGEVVGTNPDQSFKVKDLPLISKMFELSNLDEKDRFIRLTNSLYDLLTSDNQSGFKNNTYEENTVLMQDLRRIVRGSLFRFQLEFKEKQRLPKLIKNLSEKLIKQGLMNPMVTETIKEIVDENGEIVLTKDNLDILEEEVEITLDSLEAEHEETITVSVEDDEKVDYKLPLLETIDYIQFNGVTNFSAPKLKNGEELFLNGNFGNEQEGSAFLELPNSIDYNLNLDLVVNISDSENNGVLISAEPIIFKQDDHREFTIRTDFINQTNSYIDASMLEDLKSMIVVGNAQTIMLSNDDLPYLSVHGVSDQLNPDFTEIFGPKNIKTFSTGISKKDLIIQNIFFEEDVKINKTIIDLKEKPDDDLIKVILTSNVGLKSENIKLAISQYQDNGRINYYELDIKSKNKEQGDSNIKYSLAETANAAISPLLNGLNLTQQSVIARDIDKAIMNGKLSELAKNTEMDKLTAKLKKQTDPIEIKKVRQQMSDLFQADTVPFKVPRMSTSTDKAIATFIINKMAEGYNSFDFHVKKNADGPLTKQVLNALDANSEKIKQTAFRNSNLELTMNEIIEENKGIPRTEIFSEETAKNIGKGKKLDFAYLPPGDEDFEGLLYKLASGKGAMGEAQLEFFNENLVVPYSEAMISLMIARQKMYGDWKDVITKQHKGIIKLLTQQTDYEGYTYDQAVRVYLWDKAKYPIPGINNRDKFNLTDIVRTNPKLKDFANSVSLLSKQANGYIEPEKNWSFGSILGDMNNIISTVNRAKYLQDWQNRADKIFSKENLSKIEAVYGGQYTKALKNTLARLKSGTNRNPGDNSELLNWLNKSTANVMFLNTRSSVLQLLGAVNFINTSDNNIVQAATAFANLPQFWKDVKYLWSSPYLKDRRSGLMNDVAESEIAQLMDSQKGDDSINKYRRIVNWLSRNGFIGSRVFDAVAISVGGASFYRNRLNTYKKQGYTEEQAQKKTMADFYQTSEKSQQSADVSKISENQASKTGRILLSFMNTPFQYSRIMKKAAIDLAKGRGSRANNISKIAFYGFLQNIMFNALQNLVFATMWGDDDDEEEEKVKDSKQRTLRTLNGILDGIVRGMGMHYVALSVVKNALMKWYDTTGTPQAVSAPILELANISPMVGIKVRQIDKAIKAIEYNKEEDEEGNKVIPTKSIVEASTSFISVTTNLPADRIYQKVENIRGALDSQNEDWQRIALAFGFSEQNLGIKRDESPAIVPKPKGGLKSPGGLQSPGGLKSPSEQF